MLFAIRITRPFTAVTDFLDYIVERSDAVIVAEHGPSTGTGNVEHCHFHISTDTGYHAIRNRLKATYSGNGDWSCKQTYKDKGKFNPIDSRNITYILKGKLEPSFVKGVPDEEILNLRQQWVEPVRNYVVTPPTDISGSGEYDLRVRDLSIRTKMDTIERIRNVLLHHTYDCTCWHCKSERQSGQTVFPVRWSIDKVHNNFREVSRIISEVCWEAGKPPAPQDVRQYLYNIYYTPYFDPDGWRTPDFIFESLHL